MKFLTNILFTLGTAVVWVPYLVFAEPFSNPLKKELSSVSDFAPALIKAAIFIIFPIAVVFIVYSGFLFVAAQGKPDEISKAKSNFMWTVIGVALLLGAGVLATLISNTITPLLR